MQFEDLLKKIDDYFANITEEQLDQDLKDIGIDEILKYIEEDKKVFELNDIVCFKENHKWVGCIGFVNEIKKVVKEDGTTTLRLMVGVPCPMQGVAYIFVLADEVENLMCAYKYPFEIGETTNE